MEVVWIKILFLVIIFVVGLSCGIITLRIALSDSGKRRLILGNAFSGGVFLGAGLLHMLPDAGENFRTFAGDIDFPFPSLICGGGFLFILFLEKVILGGKEDLGTGGESRSFYPFILCFILSIHSIIAGASLGLEVTLASSLAIFIAIIAHKGAAAFALGISLKQNSFSKSRHVGIISLFSAMTPLGIILGTLFASFLGSNSSAGFEAIFDALAAGTFLYIGALDIVEEVFEHPSDRLLKAFLILCGFCFMALIAVWA